MDPEVQPRKTRGINKIKDLPAGESVDFNRFGQAIGKYQNLFGKYMGTRTRMTISILKEDWKHVTKEEKDSLWLDIKTHFRLENDDAKKPTLVSCGGKWKSFKTTLRGEYMHKNKSPLKKWTFIKPHVWEEFCRIENTPEKLKLRAELIERAKQHVNQPRTRLGPKGYRGFEEKWEEERNDPEKATELHKIPDLRGSNYCLARAPRDKDGVTTVPPELVNVSRDLTKASEKLSKGKSKPGVDPLIMVFGSEHGGRTRGVGGDVGYKKGIEGYVRKKRTFKQRQDSEEIHNQVKKQVKEVLKSSEFWQEMKEEMKNEMRAEFADMLAARQDDVQTPISKAPAKTASPQYERGPSTTRPAALIVSTIDQEMTSVEPVSDGSRKPRILLAASGSVDCIKFGSLCSFFSEWAEVRAVATQAALHFIDKTSLPKDMILYTDEDEWSNWSKAGDPVLHVELRRWADIMVIAPLSANTLAKIAGGLCDNLLTSIIRAWDYGKPIFVAPAMNTFMWSNPLTEKHFMSIDELGITLLPPVSKKLACGDSGTGAMADPSDIFSCVKLFLELHPHEGTLFMASESAYCYAYDVFLSFKGRDTRKNFIGHLYQALTQSGIRTFRHDYDLPIGSDITAEIGKAIQKSQVFIIVFSKEYMSSSHCLDELVNILDCKDSKGQLILPVYYNIDLANVREQAETVGCDLVRYDEGLAVDIKKAERWRAALTRVALLSGWDLQNISKGHTAKFITEIIRYVHNIVRRNRLHVAKYPVGLEYRFEDISSLVNIGSNEVRTVGIYGMGGIGKTTIAKAFYNSTFHLFEGSCFLANVREVCEQPNGLVHLQKQLLSELLQGSKQKVANEHIGISFLRERLCHKRVLIILDDLDQLSQLDGLAGQRQWFGLGSRIIITTRDENFLSQAKVDYRYEAKALNDHDSLKLFSWHAFRKPNPDKTYHDLSEGIVHYTKGLPLALEVLGASLCGRGTRKLWVSTLNKLKNIPPYQVLEKLRISFDTLDDATIKNIFLDIACFFIGMDKDYASNIFEGCGFFPGIGISILIERCLLRVCHKNKLRMHDLVCDMGKEVVRAKYPYEPGKRSRLWFHGDVSQVLSKEEGSKSVEGLVLNLPKPMHLNTKTFVVMQKLRLLQINNVHLHGSFEGLFTELRWLCWHHCPLEYLPSDLRLKKLVALDMQYCHLKTWNGLKFLTNLKSLNLNNSKFLKTTPDFSGLAKLDELSLRFCSSLLELDPSIGHLGRLTDLNLGYCENLKSLPESICNLRSLERLYLDECSNLDKLPEEVGNMESLQELHATGTTIKQLPDSVGYLKQLRNVSLAQSNKRHMKVKHWFSFFPFQILSETRKEIKFLPPTLSTLSSIKDMDLSDSNLSDADIPYDLSQLSSLRYLHLNCNNFSSLPSSLNQLCSLQHLWLNDCKVLQSISEFPPNLRTLDASNCPLLEGLPDLSNLKHLECLDFTNCSSLVVLHGLENINTIKELYLEGCSNLATTLEESLFQRYSKRVDICSIFLSRRDIPDWFNHQKDGSFISFDVLSCVESNSLAMTLWVDYINEGKYEVGLQAVIKNKTTSTEWIHEANFFRTREVNSWVSNGPQAYPIRSGDKIEVYVGGDDGLKVEKCGIHLAYKQDTEARMQQSQATVVIESKDMDDFIHKKRGPVVVETTHDSSNEKKLSKRLKLM